LPDALPMAATCHSWRPQGEQPSAAQQQPGNCQAPCASNQPVLAHPPHSGAQGSRTKKALRWERGELSCMRALLVLGACTGWLPMFRADDSCSCPFSPPPQGLQVCLRLCAAHLLGLWPVWRWVPLASLTLAPVQSL